jgi:hypothetical protein
MKKLGTPMVAIAVVALVAAGLIGAVVGGAFGDDDDDSSDVVYAAPATAADPAVETAAAAPAVEPDDVPLTGAEADRVARAAVKAAGGGTATEVDRSDDPGEAYEVEVATDAGEVDVALDSKLRRVTNAPYDD